ncbi:hypothetical protein EYW49_05625 [Siculibacillus lacustris]|uniref:Uncharacterized protein n=1 Tax=Siculibacillus lacustris TaxID=1549641 RepID=A0A4Q9VU96_9HYPH|nr:hypothetical protein [Siculibacillus lacustris]TBW39738.1 hypothetical protein EYW49_05625 [Siculibacillus lacustris]
MASFEILSGDFEPEVVRVRYSEAGRARLRLTSIDGVVEDIFLATDVVGAAAAGEGRVGEYLAKWAERDGFAPFGATSARPDGSDRLFVVLLRDGRKFVARGSGETLAEIKAAALPAARRADVLSQRPAGGLPGPALASALPRFVPGFLARLLPGR